jgi:hypothetical protein
MLQIRDVEQTVVTPMWPIPSKQKLSEAVLRFLWRQWAQLGVAAGVDHRDSWIIDPEALLLFSLEAARRNARLYDEMIDWCAVNSRRLSRQRLKSLAGRMESDALQDLLTVVDRELNRAEKSGRWKSMANRKRKLDGPEQPLFSGWMELRCPRLANQTRNSRRRASIGPGWNCGACPILCR